MRAVARVMLACLVVGLGGCAAEPTAIWTFPAPVGASSTVATAPPTPVPVDPTVLEGKAKAAAIPAKGLSGLGVSTGPKEDKSVAYDITGACGKRTDADQKDVHVAYNRTWSAQGWWVSNTVHAYGAATGADVVGQVRAAVESCKSYTATDGQYTLHGAVALPAYPGVEAGYGYCQTAKRTDSTFVSCLSFLAKGNLVSTAWIVHGATQQTNSSGIKQASAVTAEALRKAA